MISEIIGKILETFINVLFGPLNSTRKRDDDVYLPDVLRKRDEERRARFKEAVTKAVTFTDENDLQEIGRIYLGVYNRSEITSMAWRQIGRLLRDLNVDVLQSLNADSDERTKGLVKQVRRLVDQIEEAQPFDNLDNADRIVLEDLQTLPITEGARGALRKTTERVAQLLEDKDSEILEMKRNQDLINIDNRRNKLIGLIGVVLTIVFGILSIWPWVRSAAIFIYGLIEKA